jgi:hypothetical protein
VRVLVARQEITGADRQWAGDVSHRAAIEPTLAPASPAHKIERSPARQLGIYFGI